MMEIIAKNPETRPAEQFNQIKEPHETCGLPISNSQANPLGRNMASNFISSGCELFLEAPSLGEILTAIPKLCLCAIPHWIGHKIQDGNDQHAGDYADKGKYWIGRGFKGLDYICEWPIGIVRGAIDTCVAALTNLASFTLTMLAGGEWHNDPFQFNSDSTKNAERHAQSAKDMFTPGFIKKAEQFTLPEQDAQRASFLLDKVINRSFPDNDSKLNVQEKNPNLYEKYKDYAHPAFRTGEGPQVPTGDDPQFQLRLATCDDIPKTILARREGTENTGEVLALHIDTNNWSATVLDGDELSSIHVGVFKLGTKVILSFPGTSRFGMGITNIALTLGVRDPALDEADKLVAAFVAKHGAENVEVVGFSLGGALAQFAGINNGVKVTAFNAEGLHLAQRNELGGKMADADVTLINTEWDWLSQGVEHLTASAQVGRRFLVPNSGGHMDIFGDLSAYAADVSSKATRRIDPNVNNLEFADLRDLDLSGAILSNNSQAMLEEPSMMSHENMGNLSDDMGHIEQSQ